MNQAFEAAEAQRILEAFACIGRIGPNRVMLIFRIQQAWKHLAVMPMGRGYGISTDEPKADVDADTVLVAIVIKPILFDPAAI